MRSLWRSAFEGNEHSLASRYDQYLRKGKEFALAVNRHLLPLLRNTGPVAYFGFNTGALETIQALGARDVPTVVDQIDPARFEEEIVLQEAERWPGWQPLPGRIPSGYFDRLAAEWNEADVVFVNSQWCRNALIRQGVCADKIAVAPIAYSLGSAGASPPRISSKNDPLRVLWLGQVNLRKGIPYLMQAARLLRDHPIEFRVVGPIMISEKALATAPNNMRFEGPLARIEVREAYRWGDVFVLPTLSDGFAITQLEAMAHGLPVIATPNCGEVVTHGEDGMLVRAGDANAIAEALAVFEENRAFVAKMSANAIVKARQYDIALVAAKRLEAISQTFSRKSAPV
jgi:glycosyltransferase involved in cell wall biosynthesis